MVERPIATVSDASPGAPSGAAADAPAVAPAVDASMDLLNQIMRQPVDPDYAIVAARQISRPRLRWSLAVVAVVIGAMFAISGLQTNRTAPALAVERTELINRVKAAQIEQNQLRSQVTTLSDQIARLRAAALGSDQLAKNLESRINSLDPVVANVTVRGPGLLIIVDDAPGSTSDDGDRVLDLDLQIMANGLWLAGAEAISINGHRLSALTAIRGAGDAITVDYASLTPPYRVEAIGDPKTLQARYVESSGGTWWNELAHNRGMRYEISSVKEITLVPDPGLALHYAKKAGS
jgi:uncharacterized protein YlxW (UPF0749 family)